MNDESLERRRTTDAALVEEARELRKIVAELSTRVGQLGQQFGVVNDLMERQQRVDQRSAQAVFEAAQAMALARDTQENSASVETVETNRLENRRRQRWISALVAIFTLVWAFAVVNMHEIYRDVCDSTLRQPADWCNNVFVFDEDTADGAGNPVQRRVRSNAVNLNKLCKDFNENTDVQIDIVLGLSDGRAQEAAARLRATKEDCDARFPPPEGEK